MTGATGTTTTKKGRPFGPSKSGLTPEDVWIAIERGDKVPILTITSEPVDRWDSPSKMTHDLSAWATQREQEGRPIPSAETKTAKVKRPRPLVKLTEEEKRLRRNEYQRLYYAANRTTIREKTNKFTPEERLQHKRDQLRERMRIKRGRSSCSKCDACLLDKHRFCWSCGEKRKG